MSQNCNFMNLCGCVYYERIFQLHHPWQRKRSAVELLKEKRNSGADGKRRVSSDVKNILSNDQEWAFDILQLEKISGNHALSQLGVKVNFCCVILP